MDGYVNASLYSENLNLKLLVFFIFLWENIGFLNLGAVGRRGVQVNLGLTVELGLPSGASFLYVCFLNLMGNL